VPKRFAEITRLVENPENLRRDMGDAMELVRDHFHTRYRQHITKAIEAERQKALSHPSKEVALLSALKEFAPSHSHENYDRASQMLVTLGLLKDVNETIRADESVHADGIYDIDLECSASKLQAQTQQALQGSRRPGRVGVAGLILLLSLLTHETHAAVERKSFRSTK
jgi:hypothetical protein